MTRRTEAPQGAEAGFTLLEVLVTLLIIAYAVPLFQVIVGKSVDRALVTKVNRQMLALAQYQMGQITVGKLHPDEEDPFPDGQTGTFDDIGGYPEEYASYTWSLRREEIAICGANEEDLEKAGFTKSQGGGLSRPQTDDILSGEDEHVEKPEGQFKSRVTLTVYWHAENADDDLELSIVTYLPVSGEEEGGGGGAGGRDGDPSGGPGTQGQNATPQNAGDRSGSVTQKDR
jgi:prepilin-type N-terminal cleavage/methylation domain-containing protein